MPEHVGECNAGTSGPQDGDLQKMYALCLCKTVMRYSADGVVPIEVSVPEASGVETMAYCDGGTIVQFAAFCFRRVQAPAGPIQGRYVRRGRQGGRWWLDLWVGYHTLHTPDVLASRCVDFRGSPSAASHGNTQPVPIGRNLDWLCLSLWDEARKWRLALFSHPLPRVAGGWEA